MAAQPTGLPGTDPLWAWDTPKWTNQSMGTTVTAGLDLEGSATTVGTPNSSVMPGAGLAGLAAATMDPASSITDAFLPVTNVFYGALVQVNETYKTTNYTLAETTAGTSTHAYAALLDVFGNTLAASADGTTALASGTWATAVTIAPGYYYLGIALTQSGAPKFAGAQVGACTAQNQTAYSATAPYVFPRFVTSTSTVTISSSFPTSVTLVLLTTLGAPLIGMY